MAMLRFMYVFFAGLFLALFVGTGISVFYPSPQAPTAPAFMSLPTKTSLTDSERSEQIKFDAAMRSYETRMAAYNRNVSVVAITIAVLILIVALLFSTELGTLANALLLGGILTLIYAIGRGMASGSNTYRFVVAAVGLGITLVLGYIKFQAPPEPRPAVRSQEPPRT